MSQNLSKKRKLDDKAKQRLDELEKRRIEIKKYAESINRGDEEGVFGENDLTQNSKDEFILKKKREKPFQILPLLHNGNETGWGTCTTCEHGTGRYNKKVFKVADKSTGCKVEHIRRHLRSWHSSEEERREEDLERAKDSRQPQISSYLNQKRLNQAQIAEMRQANLEVMTTTNVPLGFFNKPAMKKRDQKLLIMCGYSPDDAAKFNKSAESMKRDGFKQSDKNKEIIKEVAPILAKDGNLAIAIDYKSILNQKGDEEPDALGVELIVTLDNHQRYHYLLDYIPSSEKDKDTTVKLARQCLEEYGLWTFVESGQVNFVSDAGLVSSVKKMAPNCLTEICQFHTMGRVVENTLGTNLELYCKRAKENRKQMRSFITFCKNGFSKEERKHLPSNTPKSINSWTFDHVLTETDRLNMGKYLNPKGWKKSWNEDIISNEDTLERTAFLQKFKRLPVVTQPISIRPRSMKPCLDVLMILKPHLVEAKENALHPLHEHVQNDLPDFDFVEAQQTVMALIEPFIDFFERDDNQQSGEYFTAVTHMCKWAGSPQENNSKLSRELQKHKDSFKSIVILRI